MNKHNGRITDQCKQKLSLCHIGLVKDRDGDLVNPVVYLAEINGFRFFNPIRHFISKPKSENRPF